MFNKLSLSVIITLVSYAVIGIWGAAMIKADVKKNKEDLKKIEERIDKRQSRQEEKFDKIDIKLDKIYEFLIKKTD